ncbi:fimbrial protein [Intestinirhabdus alba]|jgi:major type 1 subunit fimbrin (pilin)|uniref:Fimbrial protein n=1 Tax=Intestinirhabdus alba TaxID=2899544 RepID=A0A6L6IJ28_9ENTR|nr:fimbrial protein [Intestinirhabdus alba]MTH45708.1 fimbrial protein [Intestinirhabdus alba]
MKKVILSSLIALALGSTSAMASNGTITIKGKLTSATCTVKVNGGTSDATVTLPTLPTSMLAAANATAGATNFTMNLTGCTNATNVRAFFEAGPNVEASTGLLKNTLTTGNATNVKIQLMDEAGHELKAGDTSQRSNAATPLTSGAANLSYSARYFATGAAGAGAIETSVTYSIDYL